MNQVSTMNQPYNSAIECKLAVLIKNKAQVTFYV